MLRVRPAQQGFGTEYLTVQVNLRLIVEPELVDGQRIAQVAGEPVAGVKGGLHFGGEEGGGVAATIFGTLQCKTNALEEVVYIATAVASGK